MLSRSGAQSSAAGLGLKCGILRAFGCVMLAMTLGSGTARADLFDAQTIINNTGTSQSQMNLIFGGNVTGAIDATSNPFGAGGSQSIVYNSMSNTTTVTFSGGTAIAAGAAATYGLSFNVGSFQILDSYWNTLANAFPALSVAASSMSQTGTTYYGLFFTELAFNDGPVEADMYEELPIPGGCGAFDMTNNNQELDFSPDTVTTFDSAVGGAWITWPIPLNKLDPTDTPATEPLFWPVTSPADVTEGQSFEEDVYVATPCPKPAAAGAALIAMMMGIAVLKQRMSARAVKAS